MMGTSLLHMVWACLAGIALGVWFFGGLLWTVRRLPTVQNPLVWTMVSLLIRGVVVIWAIVWMAQQHWLLPAVALLGFVAVRQWLFAQWGPVPTTELSE